MDLLRSLIDHRRTVQVEVTEDLSAQDILESPKVAEEPTSKSAAVPETPPFEQPADPIHIAFNMMDHDLDDPNVPISQLHADFPLKPPAKSFHSPASTMVSPGHVNLHPSSEQPVAFSLPSSAENVSLAYQLFTNRHVKEHFTFMNIDNDFFWGCKLVFNTPSSIAEAANIASTEIAGSAGLNREMWETWDAGSSTGFVTIQDRTPYASKKLAKEHVAEMAIPVLRCLPEFNKRSGLSSSSSSAPIGGATDENWIGTLLEFCNATGIPQAKYQEFSVGLSFACELAIQPRPNYTFGGRMHTFPSKKTAKVAAARDAVTWLRESGHMAAMELAQKRKKGSKAKKGSESPTVNEHDAKRQKTNIGRTVASANHPGPVAHHAEASAVDARNYTTQVKILCTELNMSEPRYATTGDPTAPPFFCVTASFATVKDLALVHAFRILPKCQDCVVVQGVKVRDQAVQACAAKVLKVLLELRSSVQGVQALNLAGLNLAAPAAAAAAAAVGSDSTGGVAGPAPDALSAQQISTTA